MKILSYFSIAITMFLFTACGSNFNEDYGYYEEGYYEDAYYENGYTEESAYGQTAYNNNAGAPTARQASFRNGGGGKVIQHKIVDPKTGMTTTLIPLPSNWKITSKGIQGPNGTTAGEAPGGALPQGRNHNIDQVISTKIDQLIRQYGAQKLNVINLPEVARNDQKMMSQYWTALPDQKTHEAKGVEVKNQNGRLGLIIVHLMNSRSQYGNFSYYYMHLLEADPSVYEQAKAEFLYGLANMAHTPEYLAYYNQQEQQKSNASWARHNDKMRRNQANFDAWQKTQQTYSDISDIQHEGWKRRNAINDAGHAKTIDGIWEREAVTNPYSGQQTHVQSGYKYYYMNQFGEYIGSNDEFYNPAQDPNMNHLQWQQVQYNGY